MKAWKHSRSHAFLRGKQKVPKNLIPGVCKSSRLLIEVSIKRIACRQLDEICSGKQSLGVSPLALCSYSKPCSQEPVTMHRPKVPSWPPPHFAECSWIAGSTLSRKWQGQHHIAIKLSWSQGSARLPPALPTAPLHTVKSCSFYF
jgi:hypothetical protein